VLPVHYTDLVFGAKKTVKALDSTTPEFIIPSGTKVNTRFKLKGLGLRKGDKIGDLIVGLDLFVPQKPKKEYKKVLKALAALENKN
jgi:molecular chaperone DnaJ